MENIPTLDKDKPLTYVIDNDQFFAKNIKITKEEIEAVPGAFVLRNILTPEECSDLIDNVFSNEEEIKDEIQPVLFRKWVEDPEAENKKLGVRFHRKGEDFNQKLWERIKDFVPQEAQIGDEKAASAGFTQRVRFIRYDPGQRFPPHTDGPFVASNDCRSLFTFVVYLDKCKNSILTSGDFRGGELYFYEKPPAGGNTEDLKKIFKVIPECGTAVIFPHLTLHESRPLKNGHKYCIRNDILYQTVAV